MIDYSFSDKREMKRQNLVRPSFKPSGDDKKLTGENVKYDFKCSTCGGPAFEEILELVRAESEDGRMYECRYKVKQIVCMADGRKLAYSKFKLSESSRSRHKDNCCPVIRYEELVEVNEYCDGRFRQTYLSKSEEKRKKEDTRPKKRRRCE